MRCQRGPMSWYDDWPHLSEEVTDARRGYVCRPKSELLRERVEIQIHLALDPEAKLSTTSPSPASTRLSLAYLLSPIQDGDWFWPQATARAGPGMGGLHMKGLKA